MKKVRVKTSKAEVYTINNFLNDDECQRLIDWIDSNNIRSQVSGGEHKEKSGVSKVRTSSTSTMRHQKFPYIRDIDRKISRALNVPLELGEVTQGQMYDVGQEFKDHTDYFGKDSYKGHGDKWGNRVWTFMIYLNDDCEGGETDFKRLGVKFSPEKGKAVMWRNMTREGNPNPHTLHAGRPVINGTKYIITKWFREKPVGAYPISNHFKKKYPHLIESKTPPITKLVDGKEDNSKVFNSYDNFPRFTELGFELRDVPKDIWALIEDAYKSLQSFKKPEKFKGQIKIIYDKDKKESPVDILSFGHIKAMKKVIHEAFHDVLAEWSGQNIIPSMMYGIRSYKKGAILVDHKDRIETHHISCIIIVDEKSNKPWPLDIQDHTGKWHKVYAKPGQMIMYESAACQHGRLEEYDGEFFRNFFVHFKLSDWSYVPEQKRKAVRPA